MYRFFKMPKKWPARMNRPDQVKHLWMVPGASRCNVHWHQRYACIYNKRTASYAPPHRGIHHLLSVIVMTVKECILRVAHACASVSEAKSKF
nr:MAG TPA_asm: hypothetical protein [Caudoviricetes sp.]